MIERFILVWLLLASAAAMFWPQMAPAWMGDPFVAGKPAIDYFFAATMFAIGMMLPRKEVDELALRWKSVLGGTAVQYSVMPLLAFGFAKLFGVEGRLLTGMVVVGCVPGAMASNVLTLNARGNASYSVSLTTAATLLSPIIAPLTLGLFLSGSQDVNANVLLDASLTMLFTVVLPVVLGHLCSRFVLPERWEKMVKWLGSSFANLVIVWIIAVVVALNRERLYGLEPVLFAALLCVNLCGYMAGYAAGATMRIPRPMRRALTLEVGMQNAGLGALLATKLFDGKGQEIIAIPPAIYMFLCMVTGVVLARTWATWGAGDEDDDKSTGASAPDDAKL